MNPNIPPGGTDQALTRQSDQDLIQEIEQMIPYLSRLSRIDTNNLTDNYQLDSNEITLGLSNLPTLPNITTQGNTFITSDNNNNLVLTDQSSDSQTHGVGNHSDSSSDAGYSEGESDPDISNLDTISDISDIGNDSESDIAHPNPNNITQCLSNILLDRDETLLDKFLSKTSSDGIDELVDEITKSESTVCSRNIQEGDDSEKNHTDMTETFREDCKKYRTSVLETFNCLATEERYLQQFLEKRQTMKRAISNLVEFMDCIEDAIIKTALETQLKHIYQDETNLNNIIGSVRNYAKLFRCHQDNIKCLEQLNFFSVKPKCPLCFETEIDTVCLPCGHSGCRKCLDKCNLKCGVCREVITRFQRLYII